MSFLVSMQLNKTDLTTIGIISIRKRQCIILGIMKRHTIHNFMFSAQISISFMVIIMVFQVNFSDLRDTVSALNQ